MAGVDHYYSVSWRHLIRHLRMTEELEVGLKRIILKILIISLMVDSSLIIYTIYSLL